jgi:hypothetical protein
MNQVENFVLGTPVKMAYRTKENEMKHVYAKVLCSNVKDENIYSCVTPHGSVIRAHYSNISVLDDNDDLSVLKQLENNSIELNNIIYNNILNSHFNTGIN